MPVQQTKVAPVPPLILDTPVSVTRSFDEQLISLGHKVADAARKETLAYFRSGELELKTKDSMAFDPVTIADRKAEEAMRAVIKAERPEDGVYGEEFGVTMGDSDLFWVLDPIDGTRGYISGTPTWGVLIAVHDGNRPIFGIIDQPYIGERFVGGLGQSSFKGPHGSGPLKVSAITELSEATIFTTYPEVGEIPDRAGFHAVAKECKLTRYGMDCYAYAMLAMGQVDLVIEAGLAPYDIQAPIAVIEAAGGLVTDWAGGPVDQGGRAVAAATPELHAKALELLRQYG